MPSYHKQHSHNSNSPSHSPIDNIQAKMASFLLPRTSAALGIGLGFSFSLSPLSPFRSAPMQCQYAAPYSRSDSPVGAETGWAIDPNDPVLRKQGRTGHNVSSARKMRQVSLGSVLGLLVGVGLRAFSRALAVLLGIGIVAVEVCFPYFQVFCLVSQSVIRVELMRLLFSGLRLKDIISFHSIRCRNTSRASISTRP